jgi:hypothetical protein
MIVVMNELLSLHDWLVGGYGNLHNPGSGILFRHDVTRVTDCSGALAGRCRMNRIGVAASIIAWSNTWHRRQ